MDERTRTIEHVRGRKAALEAAIAKGRSRAWILRLWSRFIRARDNFQCLCCEATDGIQAHHIIRKVTFPESAFDLGNGVTMCRACHARVHAEFNGRPDMSLPLGAEQGDDQDEWAFLFGLLYDDAFRRGLDEDEFYYLGDPAVMFSLGCQGHQHIYDLLVQGHISRIRFAHEIWRMMPEGWYTNVVAEIIRLNFEDG
jgi:hypothetical protein